jgi:predicted RNA-binding protein associated with RNAse of E/G family
VTLPVARIHYLRLPDRQHVYHQVLVHDAPDVRVTLARSTKLRGPLVIGGFVALDPGSDVVWFTFPGRWHDIGRFHRLDGTFTGIYSNVLTPPVFEAGEVWRTTDLFLDVWIPRGGSPAVLDRDEFDEAVEAGWVDDATGVRALEEVQGILAAVTAGDWPPGVVDEWTLERARAVAGQADARNG